jgi:ferredoxin
LTETGREIGCILRTVKIYYYSGTGNSLAVARRIVNHVPDAVLVPVIRAVPEAAPQTPAGGASAPPPPQTPLAVTGTVGLVFPVHMTGVPKPVRRFLESADFSGVDYLFAVATHGGYPGQVGALINRILARSSGGAGVSAGPRLLDEFFPLEMLNNTPKGVAPRFLMRMNWAETITPERLQEMVSRTTPEIDAIVAAISVRTTGFAERYRRDARSRGRPGTRLLWRLAEGSQPKLPFVLDRDACTRCGICRDVCPTGRVVLFAPRNDGSLAEGFPTWPLDAPCHYCYACFNFCPEQAVGVKHYTFKDGRYAYPGITAADIAAQKG